MLLIRRKVSLELSFQNHSDERPQAHNVCVYAVQYRFHVISLSRIRLVEQLHQLYHKVAVDILFDKLLVLCVLGLGAVHKAKKHFVNEL